MYKVYWGMEFNPFNKNLTVTDSFKSVDFVQATSRLEHLKNIKGIGVFTGLSGTGKTYTLRSFSSTLNPKECQKNNFLNFGYKYYIFSKPNCPFNLRQSKSKMGITKRYQFHINGI
jgi:Cdc6-like AAA superfamily ATPase